MINNDEQALILLFAEETTADQADGWTAFEENGRLNRIWLKLRADPPLPQPANSFLL